MTSTNVITKTEKTPHVRYIASGMGMVARMTISSGHVSDARLFKTYGGTNGAFIEFKSYLELLQASEVLNALIEEIKADDPGYSEQPERSGEGGVAE